MKYKGHEIEERKLVWHESLIYSRDTTSEVYTREMLEVMMVAIDTKRKELEGWCNPDLKVEIRIDCNAAENVGDDYQQIWLQWQEPEVEEQRIRRIDAEKDAIDSKINCINKCKKDAQDKDRRDIEDAIGFLTSRGYKIMCEKDCK